MKKQNVFPKGSFDQKKRFRKKRFLIAKEQIVVAEELLKLANKKTFVIRAQFIPFSATKEEITLLDSAKIASSKAIRSSMALGITIKLIKDHEIIEVNPDKSVKLIRKISKPTFDFSTLKKGMILERK